MTTPERGAVSAEGRVAERFVPSHVRPTLSCTDGALDRQSSQFATPNNKGRCSTPDLESWTMADSALSFQFTGRTLLQLRLIFFSSVWLSVALLYPPHLGSLQVYSTSKGRLSQELSSPIPLRHLQSVKTNHDE